MGTRVNVNIEHPFWLRRRLDKFGQHLSKSMGICPENELFNNLAIKIKEEGRIPDPLGLEIHPHLPDSARCTHQCKPCTGQYYDKGGFFDRGISEKTMDQIIYDVTHDDKGVQTARIPMILFAGCCIEPLIYPDLQKYIGKLLGTVEHLGILTNMALGDDRLFETFTDPDHQSERYFRVSLNATDSSMYNSFHRPNKRLLNNILSERNNSLKSNESVFDRVIANTERLLEMRTANHVEDKLVVEANYLLYPGNDSEEGLSNIIDWAESIGLNAICFRIPQMPQMCNDTDFATLSLDKALELKGFLEEKLAGTNKLRKEVPFSKPQEEIEDKPFNYCWTRFVNAVIGYDGRLYPCTSVSAPQLESFSEGQIDESHGFWDVWNSRSRIEHFLRFSPKDQCDKAMAGTHNPEHVCTRTESAFNLLFDYYYEPSEAKLQRILKMV